jgi:hypothetical protein
MRAEILTRSGHSFWAKDRQASDVIDLQPLFDDYLELKQTRIHGIESVLITK